MKKIYIASLSLSSIVLLLLIMKFFGWTIVINRTIFDKWLALLALFSVPSSVYMILSKKNVNKRATNKITILIIIIVSMWFLWSFKVQPNYYGYVESNNILPKPYLVSEKKNSKTPETKFDIFYTKYTLYKSVTPFLFKKESTVVEERSIIFMKKNLEMVEIDGGNYIKSSKGLIPIK